MRMIEISSNSHLDVLELLLRQQLLELRQLLDLHREVIRPHAHDTVPRLLLKATENSRKGQEEHPGRVILEMFHGIFVAELQVVHKGSIRMLHPEL